MDLDLRYTINRSIVIFRFKQPFLDWICQVEPEFGASQNLDDLNEDGDGYLLPGEPQIDCREDAVAWVEKRWRGFFENVLNDWYADPNLLPKKMTLKMFREWFEIDFRSMVWDLSNSPIEIEDWSDDDE
jgi:hypothetical protein